MSSVNDARSVLLLQVKILEREFHKSHGIKCCGRLGGLPQIRSPKYMANTRIYSMIHIHHCRQLCHTMIDCGSLTLSQRYEKKRHSRIRVDKKQVAARATGVKGLTRPQCICSGTFTWIDNLQNSMISHLIGGEMIAHAYLVKS